MLRRARNVRYDVVVVVPRDGIVAGPRRAVGGAIQDGVFATQHENVLGSLRQ